MKTYYIYNQWDIDPDTIYGAEPVRCISEEEVRRLSEEWETDLFEQMHIASEKELKEYGVYDDWQKNRMKKRI